MAKATVTRPQSLDVLVRFSILEMSQKTADGSADGPD